MSSNPSQKKFSGFLIGLLAFQLLLASASAQAPPDHTVSDDQQDSIEARFGAGAPFGDTWHARKEAATFYFHTPTDAATGSGTTPGAPPEQTNFSMNLFRPSSNPAEAEDRAVILGSSEPNTEVCVLVDPVATGIAVCQNVAQSYESIILPAAPTVVTQDDMQVYSFDVSVHIAGLPQNGLAWAFVYETDATGARVDANPSADGVQARSAFTLPPASAIQGGTGQTSGPIEYRGGVTFGSDGYLLPAGHSYEIELGTATNDVTDPIDPQNQVFGFENVRGNLVGTPGILFLDSVDYPSRFDVVADSARTQVWTESRVGDLEDSFPSANINEEVPRSVQDRQLVVQTVQANAWGPDQLIMKSVDADGALTEETNRDSLLDIRVRLTETAGDQDITSAFPDFVEGPLSTNYASGNPPSNQPRLQRYDRTHLDDGIIYRTYHYIYPAGFEPDDGDPTTPLVPITQDGNYRIEAFQQFHGWKQIYDFFTIGQRGFTFELADGETSVHNVLASEPTRFAFDITNVGPTNDRLGLSVPVSGGWAAELSHTQVNLPAGDSEQVYLTVTPPSSASAGDSRTFTVSAASLVNSDLKSVQVSAEVASQLTKGVDLSIVKPVIETRPTLVDSSFFQLHNTGNAEDRYVLTSSGALPGWGVSMQPSVIDVAASSREDILLQISAPPEAEAGDSFTLVIRAVSSADGAVTDVLNIPVRIFVIEGVDLEPRNDIMHLRDNGGLKCSDVGGSGQEQSAPLLGCLSVEFTDMDYDRSLVNHFRITNTGDLEETFNLRGFWARPGSTGLDGQALSNDIRGSSSCDNNNNDGVPDGWRFNIDAATGSGYEAVDGTIGGSPQRGANPAGGFSGIHDLGSVTLAAGEEMDVHMEFGYTCGDAIDRAQYHFQAWPQNDPTFRVDQPILLIRDDDGGRIAQNVHAGGVAGVTLRMAPNQAEDGFVFPDGTTEYTMIASNTGNELDTIHVNVAPGKEGWTHEIVNYTAPGTEGAYMFRAQGPSSSGQADPPDSFVSPSCTVKGPALPAQGIACKMGVGDEVRFNVRVTPPTGARFGDDQTAVVQAVSGDKGNVFDSVVLSTQVTAPFAWLADELDTNQQVEQGGIAAFPYAIRNIGLRPDNYIVRVAQAPTGWTTTLSDTQQVFAPSGFEHLGFLSITAPTTAPVGQEAFFRLEIENIGDPLLASDNKKQSLDFFATVVAPSDIVLSSTPVLARQGETVSFDVDVEDTQGGASSVDLSVDPQLLPNDWSICAVDDDNTCTDSETVVTLSDGEGTATFRLTAPSDALSASRFTLRVEAISDLDDPDDGPSGFTDVEVNLVTLFAVQLDPTSNTTGESRELIVPGQTTDHVIQVRNVGLARDSVTLSTSALPAGWSVSLGQTSMTLEPQSSQEVIVTVTAPATAAPGASSTFLMFAQSQGDASKTGQLSVVTEVGIADPEITPNAGNAEQGLAPEETGSFIVTVLNNGTLTDTIALDVALAAQYQDRAFVEFAENDIVLEAGQAKEVRVEFTMPRSIAAGSRIVANLQASSLFMDVVETTTITAEILPHVEQDVDRDGIFEYAVSRDGETDNGFEEYRESSIDGGLQAVLPNLTRFLVPGAEDALSSSICDVAHGYDIDGDDDGRCDHFLDTTADDLPDIYWDPDLRLVSAIDVSKDVTRDGVREYFIDVTGDGNLDVWFDLTTGQFGGLIQIDAGTADAKYIVDLNGNNEADDDEPILIARTGRVSFIENIDMDGDGSLDQVFDEDGDGKPDYFVPAGTNRTVAIVLEDVNGDGVEDWTYDADGDGKIESYYDPEAGESGLIDTKSEFVRALQDYWYVPALFGLVLVLFVILMAVTRR